MQSAPCPMHAVLPVDRVLRRWRQNVVHIIASAEADTKIWVDDFSPLFSCKGLPTAHGQIFLVEEKWKQIIIMLSKLM